MGGRATGRETGAAVGRPHSSRVHDDDDDDDGDDGDDGDLNCFYWLSVDTLIYIQRDTI